MAHIPSLAWVFLAAMQIAAAHQAGDPHQKKLGRTKRLRANLGATGMLRQQLQKMWSAALSTGDLLPAPKDFSCCKCVKNSFNFSPPSSDAKTCEEWKKAFIIQQQVCDQEGCSENDYLPPAYTLVHPKYYSNPSQRDMIARGTPCSDQNHPCGAFGSPVVPPGWALPYTYADGREFTSGVYPGYSPGYPSYSPGYPSNSYGYDSGYRYGGYNSYENYYQNQNPTRVTNGTSANRGSTPSTSSSSSSSPSHTSSSSPSSPPSPPPPSPSPPSKTSNVPLQSASPQSNPSSSSSKAGSGPLVSTNKNSEPQPGGGHAGAKWTDEHIEHEQKTIPSTIPGKSGHNAGFHRGTRIRRKACKKLCQDVDAPDIEQCVGKCMKQSFK